MTGTFQNNIKELPSLNKTRYERIFKVYNVEDSPKKFFFYNINKGIKIDVDNIDETYTTTLVINGNIPWTTLSYNIYGTIYLWWLIKLINPDTNIFHVESGSTIKIIKPEYVDVVIDFISSQLSI
jgi:hypothetical protein